MVNLRGGFGASECVYHLNLPSLAAVIDETCQAQRADTRYQCRLVEYFICHSDAVTEHESWASSPGVRRGMQANRGRDTSPELAVRRAVHALGLRYKVDARPISSLNRRADLVFARARVAVFVDGCFWHGCSEHHTVAKANAEFWAEKVRRNRERDTETDRLLAAAGWTIVRVWEHEDPMKVANLVARVVRGH
jgi:DNA mismatch endonuclease, patch repair protein